MSIQGRVKTGPITKNLISYLCKEDIAVISHNDMDDLAAAALANTSIRAVINTGVTMTGRFKASGALYLLFCGIPVIDTRLGLEYFND